MTTTGDKVEVKFTFVKREEPQGLIPRMLYKLRKESNEFSKRIGEQRECVYYDICDRDTDRMKMCYFDALRRFQSVIEAQEGTRRMLFSIHSNIVQGTYVQRRICDETPTDGQSTATSHS